METTTQETTTTTGVTSSETPVIHATGQPEQPEVNNPPPPYISSKEGAGGEQQLQQQPSQTQNDGYPAVQPIPNEQHQQQQGYPSETRRQNGLPPNMPPIPLYKLGAESAPVVCPRCQATAMTRCDKHPGHQANMAALITCLCFGICFAWIPLVIDSCKDSEHYCTNCGIQLAIYHANGGTQVVDHEAKARQQELARRNREAAAATQERQRKAAEEQKQKAEQEKREKQEKKEKEKEEKKAKKANK